MASCSKYSALLVDDDSTSNYINSRLVIKSNFFSQPIVLSSPQMALDYLQENWLGLNQQPLPELMLIDINMPVLDGFEFVEELKIIYSNLLNDTLLCFLSSSFNVKDKVRVKTLGVDCYYSKPLKIEYINELVTTLDCRF